MKTQFLSNTRSIFFSFLLTLVSIAGWGQIAAWNLNGIPNSITGATTYAATTFDTNLVTTGTASNITRGAGAAWSTGNNSFRTVGFKNDGIAISNTDYFQVTLTAKIGYKLSLSTIDAFFNGTASFNASPGVTSQFAYSLDGTTFTLIGSPQTSTSLNLSQINLSGVPALQNVAEGVTITLRYYASGQTSTGGWGFYSSSNSSNGLSIGGSVTPVGIDATPPTLTSTTPADDATNVAIDSNLGMTFNENVKKGTGNIYIIRSSDDAIIQTIDVASSAVSVSYATVTVNPPSDLANSTAYYIQLASGVIQDTAGNNYAGISDATTWNFTTGAPIYSINVTQPTGGSITPAGTGNVVMVTEGANQTFTYNTNPCYTFNNWVVDGANAGSGSTYTFSNVTANHTISVSAILKTYTISSSSGANGSINPNGNTAVDCGASQTYTITPNSGYVVDDVLVDGVSVGAVTNYTFNNVSANHTISASFEIGPCYTANAPSYNRNSGYTATGATDSGGSPTNTLRMGSGSQGANISATASGISAGNVTVRFRAKAYSSSENTVTVSIGGTPTNAVVTLSTSFAWVETSFTGVSANPTITFSTTSGNRLDIGNIQIFCTTATPTNTSATDYFRSKSSGNWTAVSTWQSSHDGSTGWVDADLVPAGSASSVEITTGKTVTINSNSVVITNTTVKGVLKVTDFNFQVKGSDDYELTIENGGELLVDGMGYKTNIGANQPYALIDTGGKITVGNTYATSGFSENVVKYYLNTTIDGLLVFNENSVCDWTNSSRYPQSNGYDEIFFTETGLPIFRISNLPAAQSYGNSANDNLINAILEVNSVEAFALGGSKSKTFLGGIRGNGVVSQNTGGDLIVGNSSIIPVLDGNVTVNFLDNKFVLPNGANIPVGANVKLTSSAQNNRVNRTGGTISINGLLDLTNIKITNSASGGIVVANTGTIRTAHTEGLQSAGNGNIQQGILTLALADAPHMKPGSTVEYYANGNQQISSVPAYCNIKFSGSGTKTPTNPIDVDTNGSVIISGSAIADFSNYNIGNSSLNDTKLVMDGGRLILGTTTPSAVRPIMDGDYKLTGGVIEFKGSNITKQTIRNKIYTNLNNTGYQNIEITGNNVGNSSGIIGLNPNGNMTIKSGGVYISSSPNAPIKGYDSSATLTIENLGLFKTEVPLGFYGALSTTNYPSVFENVNVNLQNGSTIEYSRVGDQVITNQLLGNAPNQYSYQTLKISGSGTKTALGTTTVNEKTILSSSTATLMVPEYTATNGYSVFNALGGIDNSNGATGNFILGNDAQLMQHSATRDNADNAKAEIRAQRKMIWSDDNRKEYNYLSSPVASQNMKELFGAGNTPSVLKLNESTNYFVNAATSDYEVKAKGFAVKEATTSFTGDTAEFKGSPNNGTIVNANGTINGITITRSAPNRGWNLIGNPYPSNIDLKALYEATENEGIIHPEFRFWDNRVNNTYVQYGGSYNGYSYSIYHALDDESNPAPGGDLGNNTGDLGTSSITGNLRYGKVGQGFLVRAINASSALRITNLFRTTNMPSNGFFRKSADMMKDRYRLQLITPGNLVLTQTILYFNKGNNEFGIDDSKHPSTGASDAFYSFAGTEKAIINGRNLFDPTDVISLGSHYYSSGTYKIKVVDRIGKFQDQQQIYLKDKELGVVANITQDDYTFESNSGEFNNRFEIIYQPNVVLTTSANAQSSIQVYQDSGDLVVRSFGKKIRSIEVYDASGRLILTQGVNSQEVRLSALKISSGLYIVKTVLIDGNEIVKKFRR